jgi:hypothetical protein
VVSLAALWATANVIGVVVGLIIVSAMGDPGAPYPWTEVLVVVLTISTASLAASLAAGRAAIRAFDGNDPSMTTERTVHHGN